MNLLHLTNSPPGTYIHFDYSFTNNKWKEHRRAQSRYLSCPCFSIWLQAIPSPYLAMHVHRRSNLLNVTMVTSKRPAKHDSAWSQTLRNASKAVDLLIFFFCQPSDPPQLWIDHWHHCLCSRCTDSAAEQKSLQHINSILSINRKSLTDYNLLSSFNIFDEIDKRLSTTPYFNRTTTCSLMVLLAQAKRIDIII